jgi:putative endonuclease
MDNRKRTGQQGEEIAADFLIKRGHRLVARNWRCQTGELDIVTLHGNTLVFVEVRTRRGSRFGAPEESITPAKQARLINLAHAFLQASAPPHQAWRIDVVAVVLRSGPAQVNHLENAVGW